MFSADRALRRAVRASIGVVLRPGQLREPVVQAPMAGGISTPALAAAVSATGGLGFIAAGYRSPDQVREDLRAVRARTDAPVGVGVFVPSGVPPEDPAPYARRLAAAGAGPLGEVRGGDDAWKDKLALLHDERPAVASFAFGLPEADVLAALRERGIATWVTVCRPEEARAAAAAGADALIVQGVEAGGHRGGFSDDEPHEDLGLIALLQLVRAAAPDVPLVAAGGIMTGAAIAAVLALGASAAQLGTAFARCPEAGTSDAQRRALMGTAPTGLTRAFSGRTARGIVNAFQREHGAAAPRAYPHVHHLTAPLRAEARARGDADRINLWAGQAYPLALDLPAAELVRALGAQARRGRPA